MPFASSPYQSSATQIPLHFYLAKGLNTNSVFRSFIFRSFGRKYERELNQNHHQNKRRLMIMMIINTIIIIILTFRRRATRVCGWQVDKCTLQLRNNSLPTSSSSRFHHHHHHHHRHHHHHNYHHHHNLIITINFLLTILIPQ